MNHSVIIIQILLIALTLLGFTYFITHINSYTGRAGRKLLVLGFAALMVVGILFPERLTDVAQAVGVGRGADLLLYMLAIGFVFSTLSAYLKFQQQRTQLHKLARHIAILEAEQRQK